MHYIGTPRAADDAGKKQDADTAVAQEAKVKLDKLPNKGTEAEPAIGNDKLHLPLHAGDLEFKDH